MEIMHRVCAGLDVHKRSIAACVRVLGESHKLESLVRTFGTMTHDIQEMKSWFEELGVTHVAMESTGVFWKPV